MKGTTPKHLWKILFGVFFALYLSVGPVGAHLAKAETVYNCAYPGTCILGTPDAGFGIPVYVTNEAITDAIKSKIDYQLTFAAYLGALNAATIAAQQVAFDTAEWVAGGFKGKSPLIETLKFGDYSKQIFFDAAGEFIGTFSDEFTEGAFGIDLCRPPRLPELALDLALSIPELTLTGIDRPRPKCAWTDVVDNWEASVGSLSNVESIRNIRGTFTTGGNDIAFGIGANLAFFDFVAEKREAGVLDRLEGGGFKNVEGFLSGNIETPAAVVQRNIEAQIVEQPNEAQNIKTSALLGNAFQLGWVQLGVVTASTFTNVLLTRLFGKIAKGLFKSSGSGGLSFQDLLNPGAAPGFRTASEEIVAAQYSDILTPNIVGSEQQDILAELVGCPDEGRTKWNCAIDSSLEAALRQGGGMTIRQAVDQGFINEQWRLIPSTQLRDNTDPTCATRAFCVANLRKMRVARIVPIGWELAADSPANQAMCAAGNGCVTLATVLNGFENCNEDGLLDAEYPWCHLIDPNWVLTSFPSQCLTRGYGNSLLAQSSERIQECQDTVTCLERDENGQCSGGYGYCLAEQTFWQFDALTCNEEYVSCRSYTPRGTNAKQIGYLRSTLDYGNCNETNVGCMWYATRRDPNGPTSDSWTADYNSTVDKVYFDSTIPRCDAQYDGCTDLRRVTTGASALNLVRNPSFEDVENGNLSYWVSGFLTPVPYTRPEPSSGSLAYDGSQAFVPPTQSPAQIVRLEPLRQYTVSFYARNYLNTAPSGSAVRVELIAPLEDPDVPPITPTYVDASAYFKSAGCSSSVGTYPQVSIPGSLGGEWQRFECSFVVPPGAAWGRVVLLSGSSPAMIDAIQLEASELASPYIEGLSSSLPAATMKVPPPELGCSGAADDHPLCANFARVCRQNEAGCQGYRPSGQSGAPEVPAVLTPVDTCPAECVGYAEFRKQASTFDLVRNPDVPELDDPDDDTIAAFIPSTALSCNAQDVGCEAFTNLEIGSEGTEAFSYLRSCEKPNDDTQTFYTWEGSDVSGYQLVTWSLQRDVTAPLPQPPRLIIKAGPDGFLKDPADCNAISYLSAVDPDCRQFYDPQGTVFYRFESQTVVADTACAQYRKNGSSQADCEKTGGTFNASTNQCVYLALGSQSNSCDVSIAGCRAYIGTQGAAQAVVFSEDFVSEDHSAIIGTGMTEADLSNESVLVGDTSLRLVGTGSDANVWFDIPTDPGTLYELTFWAKSANANPYTVTIRALDITPGGTSDIIGTATVTPEWNVYRIGPFEGVDNDMTRIMLQGLGAGASSPVFIDTFRVTQVTDVAYVVKDSWNTPASCDRTPEGIPQPQAMLGCRDYEDRNQNTVHVRQFTRLCREDVIGCNAYIHTENTDTPYLMTWERTGESGEIETTVRPADHYEYYIEDRSKFCPESQVSCRAFGLPQFSQDRLSLDTDEPFETVYLRADTDLYDEGVCSEPELFCEQYTYTASGQAGVDYFRAPGEHACEWKEGAVVAYFDNGVAVPASPGCDLPNADRYVGATYDGWFRVGTECPCYPERLERGQQFGMLLTGDVGFNPWAGSSADYGGGTYEAWAGTCPNAQAECTEFRDVNDQSDPLHPLGRAYFVINDERLDKETCGGRVDPGRGCVMFRDMSDSRLLYSTAATFHDYKTRGYRPVDPIDCETQVNHPSCIAAGEALLQEEADRVFREVYETVFAQTQSQPSASSAAAAAREAVLANAAVIRNDTNIVVKVQPDRACSQWLSCETGETVYDPQTGQFKSICADLALCNAAGVNEGEGVPFCTSYVDRSAMSDETILTEHRVVDAATYADRPVGFGSVDYSGFTNPDQFQIMDAKLEPVGSMLTRNPRVRSRYKKDYRLGIAISMDSGLVREADAAERGQLAGDVTLRPFTCIFNQTGSFGLMTDIYGVLDANQNAILDGGENRLCWVSMDQGKPPQLGATGAELVADNLNALSLAERFEQGAFPQLDPSLSRSFPNTQCKAAPQPDAPFGNEFVYEWDDSVDPPEPSRVAAGYGNANFCEYGEECSCVYKRVQYGNVSKFYNPLSTDVVNAICIGGPRDGLRCVPNAGIEGSQEINITVQNPGDTGEEGDTSETSVLLGAAQAIDDERCGEGGVCTPISNVQLVRGVTGQCLLYDISRNIAGDQTQNECLLWNPNPVMTGPGDQYHWQPTAGYQPPQSSGRYYCTAPVREPRTQQFSPISWIPKKVPDEGVDWKRFALGFVPVVDAGIALYNTFDAIHDLAELGSEIDIGGGFDCGDDFNCYGGIGPMRNSEGTFAGRIKALFYADWFTSDGSCTNFLYVGGCTGNEADASLDGHKADGTQAGDRCEHIDDERGQAFQYNRNIMRLVTTGQGTNRSYAEYAILFNPWHTAYAALGFTPSDWDVTFDYSLEDAIANFEFSVPNDKIGCGYSEEWAEGVHVDNYNKRKSAGWGAQDDAWHSFFNSTLAQGGGTLNRSTAKIVTEDGSDSGIPVKVECLVGRGDTPLDGRGAEEGLCFIKTWELNYNADGQQKFQAFSPDIGRNSLDHLSRRPVYGKCDSSKHWFSIRAVFEDTNPSENSLNPEDITPDKLVGPFQFVGLWVTACAPGGQTKYIYMNMSMNSADVCREMAETISKDSHEAVVFTDRNSAQGGYSMSNGFSWYTSNIPFGASLATGDAGEQPLFMTGVRQQNVNPLNPPTFTSPGQTYFSSAAYPTSNWGLLSNVFAKIYRIYGYYPRAVTRSDHACTDPRSPQFGQWCPPVTTYGASEDPNLSPEALSRKFCGLQGTCLRGGLDPGDIFEQKVCNTFSGINRGLDCSSDPDICHRAPVEEVEGILTPRYSSCDLFGGYYPTDTSKQGIDERWEELNSGRYRCTTSDGSYCAIDGCGTETGCSRAEAIRYGAFRCSDASVRGPDDVREFIGSSPTYASYCTRESDNSSECPVEVENRVCVKPDSGFTGANGATINEIGESGGYTYYAARYESLVPVGAVDTYFDPGYNNFTGGAVTGAWIFGYEESLVIGSCAGAPWAECTQDSDCHFQARNYWPSGSVNQNFFWVISSGYGGQLGQYNDRLDRSLNWSGDAFYWKYWTPPDSWFWENSEESNSAYAQAFWPATPYGFNDGGESVINCADDDAFCFFGTRISSYNNVVTYDEWDDSGLLRLFPGFNPLLIWKRASESSSDYRGNALGGDSYRLDAEALEDGNGNPLPPYVGYNMRSDYESGKQIMWAHYGACESLALMWQEGGDCVNNICESGNRVGLSCQVDSDCMGSGSVAGVCRGGGRDGETCSIDEDCRPPGLSYDEFTSLQAEAGSWCRPVTSGRGATLADSYLWTSDSAACWPPGADSTTNPRHPQREPDEELDSNICTHPAGYWPRPQFCEDPDDEYCGLFGYNITPTTISGSVNDSVPLPTDVTPGLYTPLYLNPSGAQSTPPVVSDSVLSYNYVDYYNPIPPQVAAPDLRACSGGTCRVTNTGSFAVDGFAEGLVNGGVGSHVATMRFYAWASHEQMPLRKVLIDWGDGSIIELPDSFMKNKKPYCETNKECSETPGLTCSTDADCPPGGGLCVSWGNCTNSPNTKCFNDTQCNIGGETGFCENRIFFGNKAEACDEQYFEFRHAYACVAGNLPPDCTTLRRCAGENERTCTTDTDCSPGDQCLDNIAPPSNALGGEGGCYDAANNRCLYTPRVIVTDNWGWCSGECRAAIHPSSGLPIDASGSPILHPNGGCFDASNIRSNANVDVIIGPNECSFAAESRASAPQPPVQTGTGGIVLDPSYFNEPTAVSSLSPAESIAGARRPWIVFPGSVQLLPGEEL